MKGFAKIIELPEYDVILMRGYDDEDGETVEMIAMIGGSKVVTTMGFDDDIQKADKAMNSLGEKHAQGFVDNVLKMMD